MLTFKVDMSPVSQPPKPTGAVDFVKTEACIRCVRITILMAYQNK